MKTCPICSKPIGNRHIIDGKIVNTQRRKFCFDCSPFGSGNNKAVKCETIANEKKQARDRKHNYKEQYGKHQKALRLKRKQQLVEMFGGKCSKCGYNRSIKALDFHHRDRATKEFNLSSLGYTCRWDRLVEEAKKCDLLCANCHREIEDDGLLALVVKASA